MHFRMLLLWVSLISILLAPVVSGQSTNASLSGQVTDTQGLLIVGADVEAVNEATNVSYKGQTNGEGLYWIPDLPPGTYEVRISKTGFRTMLRPGIILHVQDTRALNTTLQVGDSAEIVRVEGGAPLINTESAAVSTVVDQTYIANMPLNGRSFQDLILLTPGVITQTPQNANRQLGGTGEFSVNGQRAEANVYTVDGVSANVGAAPGANMVLLAGASGSVPSASALGTTQALVSVDDLQEFRVQSSTYSAEYGRNPGGQFALETKSGVNLWHGSAYDYLRNGVVDANDWFNDYLGVAEPSLRQNDFGGTIGGPVEVPRLYSGKDRSFFFVSYEGLRLAQPQAAQINDVPDLALRANTPAPLQQVLNAFPLPNGTDDVANGIAQFKKSWLNPSSIDSTSVRFDQVVSGKIRLFFRFSDTPSVRQIRDSGLFATPSNVDSLRYLSRTYTGGVDGTLSGRITNVFRLNYSSNSVASTIAIDSFGGNTPVNLLQLTGLSSTADPTLLFAYGGHALGIQQRQLSGLQRQWNLVDTLSLSTGRHQWRFGVDYRRLTPIATPVNPLNEYLYLSQSGVTTNTAFFALAISNAPAYPLYMNSSAFAQDEWRVSPRLTLSLGLRWEVNPAPGVTQGLKPYTVGGSSAATYTLAPQGTPLWKTTWTNLAPRLGAAFVLGGTPGHETVLRGGIGNFYDTGQQLGSGGFSNGPGLAARGINLGASFPLSPAATTPVIVNPPTPRYPTVTGFPSDLELPYTLQWNVSVEQALGKSQVFTLSYVGAHAARLLEEKQIAAAAAGNPQIITLDYVQNGLTADYSALQTQFQRKLSRGLTALASYTFSHCIDYGSQNYNFPYQRGSCDYDVRHNFSGAFSYDLPNAGHGQFIDAVLHGWGLDSRFTARTGFPVILSGSSTPDPATGQYFSSGLDQVPGQPVYIYGSQCAALYNNGKGCPGGWAINPDAFSPPAANALGNAPRNFVRGFGAWQMDLGIRRDFPIHERLKLQFRTEAFNVFNHPNFGTISAVTYCSPNPASPSFSQGCTFGQATGTLASTLGILSPLYQMGGSRSMQFALKLTF